MRNKKWMGRVVDVVEITCWTGILISSIIAGTFDARFAILAVALLLATAGYIWWRLHRDRRSTRKDASDALPKKQAARRD